MSSTRLLLVVQQISQKKLKKFEKEYHTIREQQEQQEAPIERYEVDVRTLNLSQDSTFPSDRHKHDVGLQMLFVYGVPLTGAASFTSS